MTYNIICKVVKIRDTSAPTHLEDHETTRWVSGLFCLLPQKQLQDEDWYDSPVFLCLLPRVVLGLEPLPLL